MCTAARIEYLGSTTGNLTTNKEYDVVAFTTTGGTNVYAVIIDDNSALYGIDTSNPDYIVTDLHVTTKVV